MTKENKGLLTSILIMIPVLWLTADAVSKVSDSDGALLLAAIIVFLMVNLLIAYICSVKRTIGDIFLLFFMYVFATFCSTIVLSILFLFVALKTGIITFGKIGG